MKETLESTTREIGAGNGYKLTKMGESEVLLAFEDGSKAHPNNWDFVRFH